MRDFFRDTDLATLHRRLTVLATASATIALALGLGRLPWQVLFAATGIVAAFFWTPGPKAWRRLEIAWTIGAWIAFVVTMRMVLAWSQDILALLLLLIPIFVGGEVLRPPKHRNEATLHMLSALLFIGGAVYLPGLLFVGLLALYLVFALAGLLTGHVRSMIEDPALPDSPESNVRLPARSLARAVGVGAAVATLVGAFALIAFPRTSWQLTLVPNAPGRSPLAAGFGNSVDLNAYGSRIGSNPRVVLRVEFPDGPPGGVEQLYLRGRSYDHFADDQWSRSQLNGDPLDRAADYSAWPRVRMAQDVYDVETGTNVLFGAHPMLDVEPLSRIRPVRDSRGDWAFQGKAVPVYRTLSLHSRISGDSLAALGPPDVRVRTAYLQLPADLSPRVSTLADSVADGARSQYEIVTRLVSHLQSQYSYTLDLPGSASLSGLEPFLFERREGHCEYFSTALAILLRTQGVPARNVNGFLGGEWNASADYLAVSQNSAHSWVEVWFPRYGWVQFDATPSGVGADGAATPTAARERLGGLRLVFDAIQHRWNKFIIEYDVDRQKELLGEVASRVQATLGAAAAFARSLARPLPLAVVLSGLLLCGALFWRWRRRKIRPESRLFLALKKQLRRAGAAVPEDATAEEALAACRSAGLAGESVLTAFLALYHRLRFGRPDQERDAVLVEMERLLRRVRAEQRAAR